MKLTEFKDYISQEPVYINPEHVSALCADKYNTGVTIMYLIFGKKVNVQGDLDMVLLKLQGKMEDG